jgi:hypothetical protein
MRTVALCTVSLMVLLLSPTFVSAQNSETENAICTFENGKQITARYNPIPTGRNETPTANKALTPGGSAMTFFTETDVVLGNTTVPTGGYTLYIIPNKKEWTLIVSKNTAVDAKYDEKLDLARSSMELGQLSTPAEKIAIYFGHTGPRKCEIDVDFGKTRGWVEFRQK